MDLGRSDVRGKWRYEIIRAEGSGDEGNRWHGEKIISGAFVTSDRRILFWSDPSRKRDMCFNGCCAKVFHMLGGFPEKKGTRISIPQHFLI